MQGRAGYDVVTPLALADGRTVLVDRGWVALGAVARRAARRAARPRGPCASHGRIAVPGAG